MIVVGPETELVIDGFPRSANTFATVAFQTSQPRPVRVAHHLHASAQIIAGVRRGLPVLVPVRKPEEAVVSLAVREPHVTVAAALDAYRRFHERILPYGAGCHVARFEQVTQDFGAVIVGLNQRFGTQYTPFDHTAEAVRDVYELIDERARNPAYSAAITAHRSGLISRDELSKARHAQGDENPGGAVPEHRVGRPSDERRELQERARALYESRKLAGKRARAEAAYSKLVSADA